MYAYVKGYRARIRNYRCEGVSRLPRHRPPALCKHCLLVLVIMTTRTTVNWVCVMQTYWVNVIPKDKCIPITMMLQFKNTFCHVKLNIDVEQSYRFTTHLFTAHIPRYPLSQRIPSSNVVISDSYSLGGWCDNWYDDVPIQVILCIHYRQKIWNIFHFSDFFYFVRCVWYIFIYIWLTFLQADITFGVLIHTQ